MVLPITTLARRASILVLIVAATVNPFPAAPVSAATIVPLRSILRACDFTPLRSASSASYGSATAVMNASSSTVSADVHVSEPGTPGAHFDVVLIQVPHATTLSCTTSAPGVAVSGLDLDAGGQGSTTVQGTRELGATGAWVLVQRPNPYSQSPAEFYTSDFVAPVS